MGTPLQSPRAFRSVSLAAALICLTAVTPAAAQTVADFYRGKTVIYNLAVPDGASWGLYGRALVEHLRDHLPGKPTVVLQVMAGGGGITASNYLFNIAPRDGTVIGTPLSAAIALAATDPGEVKFDPRKFNWIGSMSAVQDVISVWHTAPALTIEAAKKTELVMGATGRGSNTFQDLALANNLLGTKFRPVLGYKGGADISLAIERGEVQGRATTWETWVSSQPDWLREHKIIQLLQLGLHKLPEIGGNVPLLRDLVSTPEQRAIVDLAGLGLAIGRSVYAPPGVPADRLAALRTAFAQTMQDPAYIAQIKRSNLESGTWQTGQVVARLVDSAFASPPDVVAKAKLAMDLPQR